MGCGGLAAAPSWIDRVERMRDVTRRRTVLPSACSTRNARGERRSTSIAHEAALLTAAASRPLEHPDRARVLERLWLRVRGNAAVLSVSRSVT
jgi:hypothetical protein